MEKSHVGMELCFLCGDAKGVVLHKQLRPVLPRAAVYDYEPCNKCKDWMKQGIILISVDGDKSKDSKNPYRTGCWIVLKEDAFKRIFEGNFTPELVKDTLEKRVAFLDDTVWDALGLPRETAQ